MGNMFFHLRSLLFLCWGGWILSTSPAFGEKKTELSSGPYPVTVEALDRTTAVHLLAQTDEIIDGVFNELKISFDDIPFSIRYIWLKDSSGYRADEEVFPRKLRLGQEPKVLRIYGWGKLSEEKERLYRTTVLALLQGYLYKDVEVHGGMVLKDPPLWISEGLTQFLIKPDIDTFHKITHRYQQLQRAPFLQDMEKWNDLGRSRMERIWRQAFCYRLFEATVETDSGRNGLLLWLRQKGIDDNAVYWGDNPESAAWWNEKLSESIRPSIPVLGIEESLGAMEKALVFKVAKPGEAGETEADMRKLPTDGKKLDAADCDPAEKRLLLIQAESNFLVQPIVMRYLAAYSCWKHKDFTHYQQQLEEAESSQADLLDKLQKLRDRMDWFQMNFPADTCQLDMERLQGVFEYQPTKDIPEKDVVDAKLTSVEVGTK